MNQIAITIPNAEALPPSMLSNIREGFQSAFEQAEAWRELDLPTVSTPEGSAVLAEITAKIESLAKWIEAQTEKL